MVFRVSHFITLLFIFTFSFLVPSSISAFSDSFDTLSNTNWNINQNGGSAIVENGILKLSSSDPFTYPYIFTKNNPFVGNNFELSINFRFPAISGYGYGLVVSKEFPLNLQNFPITWQPATIIIWNAGPNTFGIWTALCRDSDISCTTDGQKFTQLLTRPSGSSHVFDLKVVNGIYNLYLDQNIIFTSKLMTENVNGIWIGEPERVNTPQNWGTLEIDQITVEIPSPEKEVVVVLPGFGGSWDVGAVLSGQSGNNWKIPNFIKEYDGITNSLKNEGYVEDEDFFTFPYDWRKNLDSLATDLKNFIDSKNLGDRKINLVGHSMGGLVARTYLQIYDNPNVNKVITAGSPHKGIIDAYGLWEGTTVWDSAWWQKVLLETATEVNRQPGETKIQSVRRISPSIKDLMPTEDFLVQNSVSKPWNSLFWKNSYLNQKNTEITPFLPKIVSGGSNDYSQTRSGITVESPSVEDNMKGEWIDGKPVANNPFSFDGGDGFVTENSSLNLFTNKLVFEGGHGETISDTDNIKTIFTELGIPIENVEESSFDSRKRAFVAKLNSPGKLHVCLVSVCDAALGFVFEEEKMIIIPGFNDETYSVSVESGGETGEYELLIGEVNDIGTWRSVEGSLVSDTQTDNYFYNGQTDQLIGDTQTMNNDILRYWPDGLNLNQVNSVRQKVLKSIDSNIRLGDNFGFDTNVNKWRVLDYFVASQYNLDKKFNHGGWDSGKKKAFVSTYFTKDDNYFSATLTDLLTNTKNEYTLVPVAQTKLRVDKSIQVEMLLSFMEM